jgi:hypothetical protein
MGVMPAGPAEFNFIHPGPAGVTIVGPGLMLGKKPGDLPGARRIPGFLATKRREMTQK